MDFHALPRHDLQVLAKRNGVRANMTNGAMADALAALPAVDGIEEFVQEPVAESTPAAEPVVQATAEEEEKEEAPSEEEPEKQEISLPGGQGVALTPHEVIVLDDSEEEEKNLSPGENEEKALGAGRRRATRRGRVEPVAAPATRKRAASSKADKADAAVEAVPARATRARSQRTVAMAEEEAPKTRRTSRRAVASKTGKEQEEGEKRTQGDVSDMEADVPALVSSDEGGDGAEEMDVATDAQNEEQNEPVEEQSQEDEGETEKGAVAADAVPARATRARRQRKALSMTQEEEQSQEDKVETEKGDAAADVVPARATRARSQRTVLSVAHEEEQRQEDEVETKKGDAAAIAVPARVTRARRQTVVVSAAEEEEAPKTRRTSRRAAASKTCMQQEVEEKGPQRDVSDVEAAVPAPASSDEGSDGAEVAQKEEQKQSQEDDGETQKVAAEAVPARATRARRQRTAESVAEEEAPKTRRTSRRAVASKTGTQQEEEEKRTHGGVSDMETDVPALVSSDEGGDGAEEMEVAIDAQNEGEAQKGDAAADAVPARVTRARRQRAVVSAEEEEAPKTRQTSRRAAASKTCMQQEVEEKGAQRDVSDVEAPVPAPATSDEGGDGAEAMEVAKDAQNEEQNGPDEEQSQVDEGKTEKEDVAVEAVPAGATRTRRQRAAVSAAEEEAPKTRRTSRRATARKTSTDQEQGEKATQGDVSDMEAAVDAPVSSTEGDDGSQEMEAAVDAQNEEQFPAAEAVPARATRARSHRTVVSAAEDEAPKAKRTSRRAAARKTRTEQDEEEKATQGDVSHVKEAVRAPVSSDEEADGTEEMEVAIDAQNKEQNELVEDQTPEEEAETGVVAEEEPALEEDCMVDSSVEEQLVDVQQCEDSPVVLGLAEQERSDTFQNDAEDTEVVPIDSEEFEVPTSVEVLQIADKSIDEHEEMAADMVTNITDVSVEDMAGHASEENEDCTVEKELAVAEDVDSSVQEPLVDVQQCQPCEATEEIHHADDSEMVAEAMLESGDATEEVDCSSDVAEESEEESPVAEHVDSSSVQEPLVDVQQCEATEVPQAMLESGEATEEGDCSSDVAEEESPVAEHVDSSVQEPLVNVQQFEATGDVGYASEEIEAPASDEVLQSPAKAVEEEIEVPTSDEVLQSPAKAVEENEDTAVPHNIDECVEEEAVDQASEAMDEMPQASEAMDQDVVELVTIENLSQGTVTDYDRAIMETGFTSDLTDVYMEEGAAVTAEEMPLSLAAMAMDESVKEEVVTVEIMSQATLECDDKESGFSCYLTDVSAEDKEVVAADDVPQSSATMEENVEEVVTVDNLSQVVAADEILYSSATMDEDVEEEVDTVDGLWQTTVTEEECAVNESVFNCGLAVLSVDEESVMAAESSATMNKDVEEVATVDNLSQTTVADDEWAVTESAFTGACTPVADSARDFSDQIASPFSANVFEYATKSLSMEPMVSEPVALHQENEVFKEGGNEPKAAAFGRIMHSPLSIRKLRMAVAQENEADSSVPPCTIRKLRTDLNEKVAVQAENEVKEEGNQSEAAFGGSMHSPLSIRKLRMAVAQVIEADSVPRCLTIRKLRTSRSEKVAVEPMVAEPADVPLCVYGSSSGKKNASEPMAVQLENEVKEGNQPEAAFGGIMYSPLSIRKLRTAVAQEIEADSVPRCLTIRKIRTNPNEKVAVAQENEVKEGEKSSVPLDKLSLRKLRMKLRETLNTHKNVEPKRVPLGRLDENAR